MYVDEYAAGGRLVCNASAIGVELNDVAVLCQQNLDVTVCAAHDPGRYPRVLRKLPILAMDRDEVARPDQREHELQLFSRAVARHVDMLQVGRDDVGAAPAM